MMLPTASRKGVPQRPPGGAAPDRRDGAILTVRCGAVAVGASRTLHYAKSNPSKVEKPRSEACAAEIGVSA